MFFAVIRSSLGDEEIVASSGNREVLKGCVDRTQKETLPTSQFFCFFFLGIVLSTLTGFLFIYLQYK